MGDIWQIRRADDDIGDLNQVYDGHPDIFSMKVHFGGKFTKFPGRKYVNGEVLFVDALDMDRFSVIELNGILEEFGYHGKDQIVYTHFLIPGEDLDFGLRALGNDDDVRLLGKYVKEHKLISVYIEVGKTMVHTYFCSPAKVKISEIVEDNDQSQTQSSNANRSKAPRIPLLDWYDQSNVQPLSGETATMDAKADVNVNPNESFNVDVSQGISIDFDTLLNFEPLSPHNVDEQNREFEPQNKENEHIVDTNKGKEAAGESNESSGNESENSQDSEFCFEKENYAEDHEVDMSNFNLFVDKHVEEPGNNEEGKESNEEQVGVNESLESVSQSDEEPQNKRNRKIQKLKKKKGGQNDQFKCGFYVGQTFGDKLEVKEMIKQHSIESRRQLKIVKNDKERLRAICNGKLPTFKTPTTTCGGKDKGGTSRSTVARGSKRRKKDKARNLGGRGKKTNPDEQICPWVLLVSKTKEDETWTVKTHKDEHICLQSRSVSSCTSTFLSQQIVDQIESNPKIPIKALQDQLQKKFELGISIHKALRAKAKAKVQVMGDFKHQYSILRDYLQELCVTNPGTTVKIEVEEETNPDVQTRVFKRVYICLGAMKDGFKAIGRDLLGLDGCFMKGPYPGQVLTAVGVDPNNGIYPVCYAIVEAECKNSWTWFLKNLGEDLELQSNSNFTFISDRQKGILQSVETVFPSAEHRFCLRHVHENMKKQWKGVAYKNLLWKCASALTVVEWQHAMDELKALNQEAFMWLANIPTKHWARSHFTGRAQCDVLLNNLCEVFNRQLVDGRDKPIVMALEFIREYLMKRIVNVLHAIDKHGGPLTPIATELLDGVKKDASKYKALWNRGDKYQVTGPWRVQCVVDVKQKLCACRKWELTGIPCKHLVATIWYMALNGQDVGQPEHWVSPVYTMERWKLVYSFKVNPINGMSMWSKSTVPTQWLPPKHHTQIGRPKTKRRKGADEELVSGGRLQKKLKEVACGLCGGKGHNQRICKGQGSTT